MRGTTLSVRACVVLAILGLATLPGGIAIAADDEDLAPPYASAEASHQCVIDTPATGSCTSSSAAADAASGAISMDVGATTPQGGALPGLMLGSARASLSAAHSITGAVHGVLYTARLQVDEARADASALTLPAGPLVGWTASASHDACPSCSGASSLTIADTGRPLVEGQVLDLAVLLYNRDGGLVPAGSVTVNVSFAADFTLLLGTARVALRGTLTGIGVALPEPAPETLAAPYARQDASAGCRGEIGTVTTCAGASSKRTGALRLALTVTSPAAGSLPGTGSAGGNALIGTDHHPGSGARAVLYVARIVVESAEALTPNDGVTLLGGAAAGIGITAQALGACEQVGCTVAAPRRLADAPAWIVDEELELPVPVVAVAGGSLEGSAIALPIDTNGIASLRDRAGIARASLQAHVVEVRAYTFV